MFMNCDKIWFSVWDSVLIFMDIMIASLLPAYEEVVMGQITQYRVTGLHPFTNYTFYLNTFNSKSGSYKTSIHVTAVTAEGGKLTKYTWQPWPLREVSSLNTRDSRDRWGR